MKWTVLALGFLALAGCTNRDNEAAQPDPKVAATPGPGFVRYLNLTDKELLVTEKGRRLWRPITTGEMTPLMPVTAGDRTLDLSLSGKSEPTTLHVETAVCKTYILQSDGKRQEVTGERRRPTDTANVQVFYLEGAERNPIKLTGPTPAEISFTTRELKLDFGDYKVGDKALKVEKNLCYSILVAKIDGKTQVLVLLNTPNEKPA